MTTAVREENPALLRILEGLTPDQTAAVTHGEGALLIVAGAGTGKTTVITRRIAHLVAAKRARPSEILALTFTDKAAEEMEARVDLLVPYGFADMWISTFHAFGDRVLRGEGLALGLSTDFRVLTRPEQVVFLRENLFALPLQRLRPLGDPTKHLQALVTLFSRAKDEAVTPEEYLAFAAELADRAKGTPEDAAPREEAALQQELAACYGEYQRLLGERGALYVFSDFQKSNWETAGELPAGILCRLRPVTTEPVNNVALVSARLLPELVSLVSNKLVYGHEITLGRHPFGQCVPRMPDRFFKTSVTSRFLSAESRLRRILVPSGSA
jgi:hypothetical protein